MMSNEEAGKESLQTTTSSGYEQSFDTFHKKLLEESLQRMTKKYEILLEESFHNLTEKYETLLEESLKNFTKTHETLSSEMKYYIREGNNEIKTEVCKLRKEFEIASTSGQRKNTGFQLPLDDLEENGQHLNSLAKSLSLEDLAKLNLPIHHHLSFSGESKSGLKRALATLKCQHLWYAIIILLFVIGLSVTLILLVPNSVMEGWDSTVSENTSLILYSREEWNAEKSRGEVKPLEENPPHFVIIAHTAGGNCSSFPECSQRVRDTQMDHMGRGWADMGMHFLVGGDGAAYTGLGWGKHGIHTIPFNRRSIAIYFIGNFMFILPPKRQIRAAKLLIEEGVKLGKIAPDYKLFAHKQVWATESPGMALIEDIKKWPHWAMYETDK